MRGFANISHLDGGELARLLRPHLTASVNLRPRMIIFKAAEPQHGSLSFIIHVCGLWKKKVNAS